MKNESPSVSDRLTAIELELERLSDKIQDIREEIGEQARRARRWREAAIRRASFVLLAILIVAFCIALNKAVALLGEDLGDILQTLVNAGSAFGLIWTFFFQKHLGRQVERAIDQEVDRD